MANNLKITAQTKIICILGHPIGHSLSPIMHNALFQDLGLNFVYIAFDVHPKNLENAFDAIRVLNIKGANITLPYKEKSLKYMDEIDSLVKEIGALNTVKNVDGKLIGRNTDALGAKKSLIENEVDLKMKKVIILGAGGAARAISYSIIEDINELVIINRRIKNANRLAVELKRKSGKKINTLEYETKSIAKLIQSADILINTTPVGMFPHINKSPISKSILHKNLTVFDIIYNPLKTQLLKDADDMGCQTLGGIEMLVNQGALAFEWWTSKKPDLGLMKSNLIDFLEVKNC